jgi:hypothetical protein
VIVPEDESWYSNGVFHMALFIFHSLNILLLDSIKMVVLRDLCGECPGILDYINRVISANIIDRRGMRVKSSLPLS